MKNNQILCLTKMQRRQIKFWLCLLLSVMEANCVVITKQLSEKFFFLLQRIQEATCCIHFQSQKLFCLPMNISLENLNYGRKSHYHISSWKEFSVWYPSGGGQVPYSPRSNFLLFLSGDGLRPKVEGMFLCGIPSNGHSSHRRRQHCRMRHLDALWNCTHLCTAGFYSWA